MIGSSERGALEKKAIRYPLLIRIKQCEGLSSLKILIEGFLRKE